MFIFNLIIIRSATKYQLKWESMGKKLQLATILGICFGKAFFFFGCSDQVDSKSPVLARINDYQLTVGEFERQLVAETRYESDFKLTREAKTQLLEELIKKELLIQEAKRLELDRQEAFIRAIERYWESTLIRDLMSLKGKELGERIYLTEEEVERHYQELKKQGYVDEELDVVRAKITDQLLEEKKTAKLRQWVDEMRQSADVKIDEALLSKSY